MRNRVVHGLQARAHPGLFMDFKSSGSRVVDSSTTTTWGKYECLMGPCMYLPKVLLIDELVCASDSP